METAQGLTQKKCSILIINLLSDENVWNVTQLS